MKCIDCKYCAFINEAEERVTVTATGSEQEFVSITGAWCMKLSFTIHGVEKCSAYERSKHKKVKALK